MRHSLRITLAALILLGSLSVPLPSARATNDFDYNYTYYDSQQQVVGTYREDCDHQETYDGVQDGEWMQLELCSCAAIGHYYSTTTSATAAGTRWASSARRPAEAPSPRPGLLPSARGEG